MRLGALAPWWDRGTRWWEERSLREQVLLGILAALAMLGLLLVAVVHPLDAARARAAADIRLYDMLGARLRATPATTGTPAEILTRQAATAGLPIQRIAPEGARTRIDFTDVPFDAVIRWAAAIEGPEALHIVDARITRTASGAGVSASFLVAR